MTKACVDALVAAGDVSEEYVEQQKKLDGQVAHRIRRHPGESRVPALSFALRHEQRAWMESGLRRNDDI